MGEIWRRYSRLGEEGAIERHVGEADGEGVGGLLSVVGAVGRRVRTRLGGLGGRLRVRLRVSGRGRGRGRGYSE